MIKECPKCGNTVYNKEGNCYYCVWKGDAGPGKEFRGMNLNPDFSVDGKKIWDQYIKEAQVLEDADPVPWDRPRRKAERRACLDKLRGAGT